MVMIWLLIVLMACSGLALAQEEVGERPYEMVRAGRTEDHHPPLIDFEDLSGWTVETQSSEATFERSRERLLWGEYVGKLTYRGTDESPLIELVPPEPVEIDQPFDAVTLWVYGNNWAFASDPSTPQVSIDAVFEDPEGEEFGVNLTRVRWKEWFMPHRRLTEEQIQRVADGARFKRLVIRGGHNEDDRVIYLDNLVVFTEQFPELQFDPRPERGIEMFPGQGTGTNTGPGTLPFPTREETILPPNLTDDFTTSLARQADAWLFTYEGADGVLTYRLEPQTGTWSDVTAQWEGRGEAFRPLVEGGVYLETDDGPAMPESAELLSAEAEGDEVTTRWRVAAGDVSAEVQYTFRLWAKSLVIDTICRGGAVGEVRYGHAEGLAQPSLVTNPYYTYRGTRPAVAVAGPPDEPLFVTGNTDWYLSNSSLPFAENDVDEGRTFYQGGTRYTPRTDGTRNDCYERFFVTVSPRYEEMLPIIPNPRSQWFEVTGTRVWRAHGAGDRERDKAFWRNVHRHGMTEVVVTDHETMWRDGGESFTFRTKAAPGKGGDEGAYEYARVMQDELGFVYGPYNNFTDYAAVNQYFTMDNVIRTPDNQLQRAWPRCYAPKPQRAVEFCEMLAPRIEEKFHFSTAYCDVHTAVAPWHREDYDYRVPGAGTFGATFYNYGEIMLLQKAAWDGPVYSEGGMHWMYVGLTDGNYGQDQPYDPANNPWLVDFDLRRMHNRCTSFGMGNTGMFFGRHQSLGRTRQEVDASIDRFLAATVAFGHTGFLTFEGGYDKALRSYYMLQQLHSRYAQAEPTQVLYANADGELLPTTEAVATGAYRRSQVVTRYDDGTVTAANGSRTERMRVTAFGRDIDLPPNGYAGWTDEGDVEVRSAEVDGHRTDYAATPAYLFVDGRGRFTRFERAAGNGIGICRILGDGRYEVIPYQGAECGFDIQASEAVALDADRNELGPAEVRRARGLTYVMPVEGAFSYVLSGGPIEEPELACDRARVIAGETVTVRGEQVHEVAIPADAEEGDRVWQQREGRWIDFTVAPLARAQVALDGNTLNVTLESNLAEAEEFAVSLRDETRRLALQPGEPTVVGFDLGVPEREDAEMLVVELSAAGLTDTVERGMQVIREPLELVPMPAQWRAGMRLRGEEETTDFGETRAHAHAGEQSCGGETKDGLRMHPPWVGATGYTWVQWPEVTLPEEPPAAMRAWVGKGDGSDPGDGILYKLVAVDEDGTETVIGERTVLEHEWLEIEGNLSPWAGQTIAPKLIVDPGPDDDTSGDWACAADVRIESLEPVLNRVLEGSGAAYRREPGPYMVEGLSVEDLRSARRGWLHYDGMGLSGTGDEYGSFAVLNTVELGNMAPAGGNETENVWAENVSVPLTQEAIDSLGFRNRFVLKNPRRDYFKVRRFWIELELADGRKASSQISTATFTQPPGWRYAEGIGIPFEEDITVDIWFDR